MKILISFNAKRMPKEKRIRILRSSRPSQGYLFYHYYFCMDFPYIYKRGGGEPIKFSSVCRKGGAINAVRDPFLKEFLVGEYRTLKTS